MRDALAIVVALACLAQEPELGLIPRPQEVPPPRPEVVEPLPDLGRIIGEAVQAAKPAAPVLTVHVADFPCPPCERLKATLTGMSDRLSVVYQIGGESQYPALKYAGHTWYGAFSESQITAIIRDYTPKPFPQAVSVGRLQIRSLVASILDRVQAGSSGPTINLGSGVIVLPQDLTMSASVTPDSASVGFSGDLPVFKYGIVSAPVSSLSVSRDKARLVVGGWPVEMAVIP